MADIQDPPPEVKVRGRGDVKLVVVRVVKVVRMIRVVRGAFKNVLADFVR